MKHAKRPKTSRIMHRRKSVGAKRGTPPPHRVSAHRQPADEHAARELVMYIENESDLSPDGPRGQGRSVLLNTLRRWRKGTYDPKLAVKLFEYLAEAGARRYAKEFATEREWSTMFNPATRHEAAKQLEASFRNSVENGEYDHVDTRPGGASRGIYETRRRSLRSTSQTQDRSYIRLYKVIAQGRTITHLGRTTFSKTQAEDLANDLRRRGYGDVRIEQWDPKQLSAEEARRKKPPERPAETRADRGRMDAFTRAYFETALWSTTDFDDNYGIDDIDPATRDRMIQDCADFQNDFSDLMLDGTSEQGGHDFWLTRNGHGAGFWDGDWEHGEELTEAAKDFGEYNLYIGDDGVIYGDTSGGYRYNPGYDPKTRKAPSTAGRRR